MTSTSTASANSTAVVRRWRPAARRSRSVATARMRCSFTIPPASHSQEIRQGPRRADLLAVGEPADVLDLVDERRPARRRQREPDRAHQVGAVGGRRDADRRRLARGADDGRRHADGDQRQPGTRELAIHFGRSCERAPAGPTPSAPRRNRRTDHLRSRARANATDSQSSKYAGRPASIASCIANAATSRISTAGSRRAASASAVRNMTSASWAASCPVDARPA